jgi:hypothetical protein
MKAGSLQKSAGKASNKQEAARDKLLKEVEDRERQREEKERLREESKADKLLVELLP